MGAAARPRAAQRRPERAVRLGSRGQEGRPCLAREGVEKRGLAAAGRAHDGQQAPGLRGAAHIAEQEALLALALEDARHPLPLQRHAITLRHAEQRRGRRLQRRSPSQQGAQAARREQEAAEHHAENRDSSWDERRLHQCLGRGSCGCAGSARQLRARRCHGVSADAGLKNRGACARSAACRPCGGPDASCAPALRVRAEHSPVGADARPRPRHLHRKVPSLPRTVPPCRLCAQRRPRLRACWQRLAAHASVGDGSDLVDLSDLGTISVGDLGSRGAAILKDDAYSCGCVRACVRAFAFVFVFEFAFVFACVRRANRSARQARCYVNDAPAHAHANAHTSAQTTS